MCGDGAVFKTRRVVVERWMRVIGCKKPVIVWSWCEGRFGGRERA